MSYVNLCQLMPTNTNDTLESKTVLMPLNFSVFASSRVALTTVFAPVYASDGRCHGLAAANVR